MVSPTLARAYAECARLAREHYENFPVASTLLPAAMRPHVAAVYAFARTADDFADEGDVDAATRLLQLDEWEARLDRSLEPPTPGADPGTCDLIFAALGETIRSCRLGLQPFRDLLSAFRQDVTKHRYDDFPELLDYCRRSANPVGRLVLRIAGYERADLDAASDALCSALQLTNFWQDLERDWRRDRLYVPLRDLRAHGAREADLSGGRLTPAWRSALRDLTERTRALFERGRGVCDAVGGRLGLELRFTWVGGSRILDRLEAASFDVFRSRPSLGRADLPSLAWGALTWRRGGTRPAPARPGAGATVDKDVP